MTAKNNEQATDKVLSRVKKMLALANDAGASEGERENAMRMVHNILTKYNISMAEAEAHGGAAESREQDFTESRDQPWCRRVASAIGRLFFCKYFFAKSNVRGRVSHYFVGRVSNVETAKAVSDYAIKSIMSEANKLWKQQPDPGPWWTAFCKGAAARISERCEKLRREAEQQNAGQASTGTAIVLASFYKQEQEANEAWLSARGVTLKASANREKNRGPRDGYEAGRAYGDKVSLNRQVDGKASKKLK